MTNHSVLVDRNLFFFLLFSIPVFGFLLTSLILSGSQLLIETSAIDDVPKCSAVSTLVNRLPLKPFLWRNYR